MRDIPEDLAARIESGAATLCHVWIATRADGVKLGFTDHDRDLIVDGVVCRAASGWTQGSADSAEGLAAGNLAIGGVLDDDRIVEADIAEGLWDDARIALWRVDWFRPDLRVALGTGALSRIQREGESFVAEIDGPLAALDRVVGRTYGRGCDAVLGDDRCRADPAGRTCDKRLETCVGVFANGINFRGFPEIPGDDFLTAIPATGGRHDGGSRR
jgi:hypothetical protein